MGRFLRQAFAKFFLKELFGACLRLSVLTSYQAFPLRNRRDHSFNRRGTTRQRKNNDDQPMKPGTPCIYSATFRAANTEAVSMRKNVDPSKHRGQRDVSGWCKSYRLLKRDKLPESVSTLVLSNELETLGLHHWSNS